MCSSADHGVLFLLCLFAFWQHIILTFSYIQCWFIFKKKKKTTLFLLISIIIVSTISRDNINRSLKRWQTVTMHNLQSLFIGSIFWPEFPEKVRSNSEWIKKEDHWWWLQHTSQFQTLFKSKQGKEDIPTIT